MTHWKPVPGLENVDASSDGKIRHKGRVIIPHIRVRNYFGVKISKKHFLLHRLVLMAFSGEPPSKRTEAMHLNGNPQDNRAVNLRWGTHAENMEMDRGNNHAHPSAKNPNSKLTPEEVILIRETYKQRTGFRWGRTELAKRFGISEVQVLRIAKQTYGGWR